MIKPLIYKQSLSSRYTVCPFCKFENPDYELTRRFSGLPYANEPLDICPSCGRQYDMENVKVIKSKDVLECEALGLKGAVTKNEKGKWVEA